MILWMAVLATSGWSLRNHYFNGRFAKEDVRGAANYLEARVAPGECVLVPTVTEVFEHYYDRDTPLFKVSAPRGTSRSQIEDQLVPLFATCDSVWYVRAREWVNDPDGLVLGVLHGQGEAAESINFAGVTLIRFVQKNPSPH